MVSVDSVDRLIAEAVGGRGFSWFVGGFLFLSFLWGREWNILFQFYPFRLTLPDDLLCRTR